jgi:hypothetical protein
MSEIDARDFGRLEAQVEALHSQVTQLSTMSNHYLNLPTKAKVDFGWV